MSNKTDDFDGGGVSFASKLPTMEQIQELIGNHSNTNLALSDNSGERQYGPWRHPRAINHKYCDSCGESGDLMCCDKCPASFHLECLDPPMSEEDAPSTGEFVCKRCTSLSTGKAPFIGRSQKQDDEAASTCSNTSAGSGPTTSHATTRKRRGKKANNAEPPIATPKPEQEEIFYPTSDSAFRNAFQMLLFASKYTNPKEFQLEKGHCINDKIPDTYKSDAERKAKGVIELENGIVPLPLKFCHICKRTCRVAPLLQCDFCPLLYHLDCLDPPLSIMPPRTDRWMCPVHAEHAIDNHVLTSSRLSERVRLWDEFARRSNRDTQPHNVKMRFLRRTTTQRHRRLLTGTRPYPEPKVKVRVPDGVKMLYKHPPMLLPRLGDFEYPSSTLGNFDNYKTVDQQAGSASLSDQEKDTWLKAVLKFNTDALLHLSSDSRRVNSSKSASVSPCYDKNFVEKAVNGEVNDTSEKNGSAEAVDSHPSPDADSAIDRIVNQNEEVDLKMLDSQVVMALAQRQLDYLSRKRKCSENGEVIQESANQEEQEPATKTIRLQDGKHVVLTRSLSGTFPKPCAVLSPLSGGDVIPFNGRRLTIGSDLNQDVCLMEYGLCNFVSPRHAIIFYDKYSRLFELLNYSGHGTSVDAVLYSCDLAPKCPDSPKSKGNRLVRSLAGLMEVPVDTLRRNRRKDRSNQNNWSTTESQSSHVTHVTSNSNEVEESLITTEKTEKVEEKSSQCACFGTPSSVFGSEGRAGGLEGSAVLHHGSVLKFGCLQFVFSVVDSCFATPPT